MPCYFAHYTLGGDVLARLPDSTRELIERNRGFFDLGCQGPDAFLFYTVSSRGQLSNIGTQLQAPLVARAVAELLSESKNDERLKSYFFGYLCHYALDCAAHPYVLSVCCGLDHTRFEVSIDKALVAHRGLWDGFSPYVAIPKKRLERELDGFWSPRIERWCGIKNKRIYSGGVRCMRRYLRLFYDKRGAKRRLFSFFERLSGRQNELTGILLCPDAPPALDVFNSSHAEWTRPWSGEKSREDFLSMFERGVCDAVGFINAVCGAHESGEYKKALSVIGSRDHGTALEGKQPEKTECDRCVYGEDCIKLNPRHARENVV